MQVCPSCGRETPEGFPRCANCGAELAAAPLRQERKVVTVLFCDLVGFTSRAEAMDPEDVRALLAPYHEHVRAELERFGGTVEKFIGDAVMAVFGAPVAHEDDPERAVRAALAIRDWAHEEGIELRIGVNTGEALVTIGGEPLATGDVVNTAARLQSAAPTGGVLVDETTYRATRDRIDYDQHDPVEAKGKAEPLPVWLALEPRARVAVERLHGATLVGRERELRALVDALERAQAERQAQLVTLVGVPGIGKSRLVYELFKVVETARFGLVYWRYGRCLPYGDGVSFWALGEIVKAQAGILESDPPSEVERKLDEAAGDPWVASHLRPLVGLEAEIEGRGDRRLEAFAAWRRFLEELAGERTLVLVVEDLHWADDDLLDFLDHLVDRAADVELLVVCTARPELLERRSTWGGGKANAVTISLSPLSDEDTSRLIGELLEQPLLAADAQADLLARAGGNPLYAEQFTRMLSERDTGSDLRLPETVQGIVAARLDLLEPKQKSLLQAAAVLGRTFWAGGVAAMEGQDRFTVEERLHPLERKDFVRRERRSTVAADSQYAFLHVLVRDVAYGQIPRGERADTHRRAAEWIESLGRQEAHADLLAHHYLSALELSAAAGRDLPELAPKAARALAEAGDRAFALNAFAPAARFYERALDLTPPDDPGRPGLLLRCGKALFQFGGGADVTATAAEALLQAGEVEGAAEAELLLAELAWLGADRATSSKRLARAVSLLEGAPPSPGKARVLAETARYAALGGENERAIAPGREALAMAERFGLEGLRAHALAYLGLAEGMLGSHEGVVKLEESIEIYERLNSPEVGRIYNNLGALQVTLGDLGAALETHHRGLEAIAQFGDLTLARWLRHQLDVPWAYLLGDWDAVIVAVEKSLSGGADYLDWDRYNCRARIRLARGEVGDALADVEASLAVALSAGDLQVLIPALSFAAMAFTVAGTLDKANRLADETLGHDLRYPIAHHSAPWIDLSWALVDLGRSEDLVAAIGRVETRTVRVEAAESIARGDYAGAARTYAEMGHRAAEAYARLRAAQAGQPDAELERAIAFFRKAGATAYLAAAEQLIAASA